MGIASDIVEHLLWPGERSRGVHHPFGLASGGEMPGKRAGVSERGEGSGDVETVRVECFLEIGEKESTEQPREDAHGEKEARTTRDPARAVRREPS